MEALREALQNERDAHAAQQREWQAQLSAQKEKAKKPFLARALSRPSLHTPTPAPLDTPAPAPAETPPEEEAPEVNFTAVKCASSLLARRRRGAALQPSTESILTSGVGGALGAGS